jgi:hypothetical protein
VCFTTVEKGGLNDVQAGLICDTCYDMNKYAGGTGKENNRPYSAETFNALDMDLDRNDCCEVWVEKLYDDGKIGFGQAGNFLVGIEMGNLKCSSLGSPNCSKEGSSAETFEA